MTLADLKRKPVVSMNDGTKIGDVDDLVIDVARWEVTDLVVVSKTGHGLLPVAKIKSIGPDAVVVETLAFIDWNAKTSGLTFHSLKELTVVDGSGTIAGHVTDLHYEAAGAIESFEVHRGGVLGLGVHITTVTPTEIRGVGERLITVEIAALSE